GPAGSEGSKARPCAFPRSTSRTSFAARRARETAPDAPLQEVIMPQKRTIAKARQAKRAGKAPTRQAGEFVREEVRKIRRGKHGARSSRQVVAIGLSKARRAGVNLPPPGRGNAKPAT